MNYENKPSLMGTATEDTSLQRVINQSVENNTRIDSQIDLLVKTMSIFDKVANRLNPSDFYKNHPQQAETGQKLERAPVPKQEGLIADLENVLQRQEYLIGRLNALQVEIDQTTMFFDRQI